MCKNFMAKLINLKLSKMTFRLFLVPKVQFWAFGSPKAEKTRGAIMPPGPMGHNNFPEAMSNRVKLFLFLES